MQKVSGSSNGPDFGFSDIQMFTVHVMWSLPYKASAVDTFLMFVKKMVALNNPAQIPWSEYT
jgi:hypothetical protein